MAFLLQNSKKCDIIQKINILSLTLSELEDEFLRLDIKKYHAKQVFIWIHNRLEFSFFNMTDIKKETQQILDEKFYFCPPKTRKRQQSTDGTVKSLFEFSDGSLAETVLMKYEHGMSICVSTQVGCRMG